MTQNEKINYLITKQLIFNPDYSREYLNSTPNILFNKCSEKTYYWSVDIYGESIEIPYFYGVEKNIRKKFFLKQKKYNLTGERPILKLISRSSVKYSTIKTAFLRNQNYLNKVTLPYGTYYIGRGLILKEDFTPLFVITNIFNNELKFNKVSNVYINPIVFNNENATDKFISNYLFQILIKSKIALKLQGYTINIYLEEYNEFYNLKDLEIKETQEDIQKFCYDILNTNIDLITNILVCSESS